MKWNTLYHSYEGVAMLIIVTCWWLVVTNRMINNEPHWQSFNGVIERGVANAQVASHKADSALKVDIRKQGNSREGLERIKRAALLQKRTNEVVTFLENTKNYLKQMLVEDRKETSSWMITQGKAYQVKKKLDKYVEWLAKEHKDLTLPKFDKIAEGNEGNALYFAWENNRDFAHTYFAYASPNEAETVLSLKQSIVKRYESYVLRKLGAGDLSSCCICYRIGAGLSVPVHTIQVGQEYTADMFIEISASRANPRMSINQTPLMVKDGHAEVTFQTQGVGKQFWEGKITVRYNGKDSTIVHRVPIEVLPK
ncbi:MAG TPA: hypothetical protein DCS93_06475 [Microscillaceae bacterium]|nr:hypothetical protein [Microscillaceae bacterium]